MKTSGNDPRIDQAVALLEGGPERQDSMMEQLQDVLALAEAAGCRDALSHIRVALDE